MKKFGIWFASTLALLTIAACNDKEDDINSAEEYDDAYYAAIATVTSSDANFTANDNGGEVYFKTEGGQVSLAVDCGCEWIAENNATDLFTITVTSTSLTINVGQNTVENDVTGTITLKTENRQITFATITVTQSAYDAPEITVEVNEWIVPAKGTLTTEFAVLASADWTAESDDAWLTVEKTDDGIRVTAAENEQTKVRSTRITLSCTDGIKTALEHISVTQDGAAYIKPDTETLYLSKGGDSVSVTIESNYDWEYTYDNSNGWFTIERNGNALIATAAANDTGENREGTVTLTAGDGAVNVTETLLPIVQLGVSDDDMVLIYTITATNSSTNLPIYGNVDCTVDWGDGSGAEIIKYGQPSHTYANVGEYEICIKGTVSSLNSVNISSDAAPLPITAVKQWGNTGLTDMSYAFYYCKRLVSLPEYTGEAFSNVTSFYGSFYRCYALAEIPEGIFEKCTKVTDFGYSFYRCTSLKAIPKDLFANCTSAESFWCAFYTCTGIEELGEGAFKNCEKAENFQSVFYGCSALKSIPSGLFDKCTNAKNFKASFYQCFAIEKIPDGLFDNCPLVEDFSYVFFNCTTITTIPAKLFTSCTKAKDFGYAFYYCTSLEEVHEGLFENCSAAENFTYLFFRCEILKTIPSGLFDSCTNATDFSQVFYGCLSLASIPKGLFANCEAAETFECAFYNCQTITEIPERLFENCTKATVFQSAFERCSSATEIPQGLFSACTNAYDFKYAFYGDTALTGESPYDEIDGVKVHLYERKDYPEIYTQPTDYYSCFTRCTGLSDYSEIPSSWGGGQ